MREDWDKNKGLQADAFGEALARASKEGEEHNGGYSADHPNRWSKRMPGGADTPGGKRDSLIKPEGLAWSRPPATPDEEAIYYGNHLHTESNPLGLHSHIPGGELSGGHGHGPQNPLGQHHHQEIKMFGVLLDGSHTHCAEKNFPDGEHEHCVENFG